MPTEPTLPGLDTPAGDDTAAAATSTPPAPSAATSRRDVADAADTLRANPRDLHLISGGRATSASAYALHRLSLTLLNAHRRGVLPDDARPDARTVVHAVLYLDGAHHDRGRVRGRRRGGASAHRGATDHAALVAVCRDPRGAATTLLLDHHRDLHAPSLATAVRAGDPTVDTLARLPHYHANAAAASPRFLDLVAPLADSPDAWRLVSEASRNASDETIGDVVALGSALADGPRWGDDTAPLPPLPTRQRSDPRGRDAARYASPVADATISLAYQFRWPADGQPPLAGWPAVTVWALACDHQRGENPLAAVLANHQPTHPRIAEQLLASRYAWHRALWLRHAPDPGDPWPDDPRRAVVTARRTRA